MPPLRSLPNSTPAAALALALALPGGAPNAARAQAASEDAAVSQTVAGTELEVRYARPRARGRRGVFGSVIHWGEVWTPGANMATTLRVSRDVTVEGVAVPKGRYSMWLIPAAAAPWELVLDRDTTLFHTQRPKPRAGQIRLPVRHEARPFAEVLTWSFPEVGGEGATLVMQWDTVAVPLRVQVPSRFTRAVTPDAARRVAGRYRLVWEPMPQPPRRDTTVAEEPDWPTTMTLTVRPEGGELRATMDPPMFRLDPGYTDWLLAPNRADSNRGDWYRPARMDRGEVVEFLEWMGVRFDVADGRARGLEIRAPNDALVAKGTRLPDP